MTLYGISDLVSVRTIYKEYLSVSYIIFVVNPAQPTITNQKFYKKDQKKTDEHI